MQALPRKLKPEMPLATIAILALLAIPRVVIHDLKILSFDSLVYQILAIMPFAIWLAVSVIRKSGRPFQDFLAVGLLFGLFLGVIHQILWDSSWSDNIPKLSGNLKEALNPQVEAAIIRLAAALSSFGTGVMVGVGFGLIAWGIDKLKLRMRP